MRLSYEAWVGAALAALTVVTIASLLNAAFSVRLIA